MNWIDNITRTIGSGKWINFKTSSGGHIIKDK